MMIIRRLCFLIPVMALCMLTGCYTTVNQVWVPREYVGYSLDYKGDDAKEARSLPPVLYRCGDDWYIAAVKSSVIEISRPVHSVFDAYYKMHDFVLSPLPDYPIYYHKITPEMAANMQRSDQESLRWFSPSRVAGELKKAGGDWMKQLPPGAQPVQAEFLKYCRSSTPQVKKLGTKGAWYSYPLAGLTFLAVDVPISAAELSVISVGTIVLIPPTILNMHVDAWCELLRAILRS